MDDNAAAVERCLRALESFGELPTVPECCPSCLRQTVNRWGRFSGRQRYRCRSCRRSFSELTSSPARYSKRVQLWPAYCEFMRASYPLRRCATLLNISLSTAFRWRHAILNASLANDSTTLKGWVELGEMRLAHSMKGARRLPRAARRRGARAKDPFFFSTRRVSIITAWARKSRGYSQKIDAPHVSGTNIQTALLARLRTPLTIVSTRGPLSGHAGLAKAAGAEFRWVRARDAQPVDNVYAVHGFQKRILEFLLPFRGVATKYLDNYLRWHRLIEKLLGTSAVA